MERAEEARQPPLSRWRSTGVRRTQGGLSNVKAMEEDKETILKFLVC
jgi:hypothetical protein